MADIRNVIAALGATFVLVVCGVPLFQLSGGLLKDASASIDCALLLRSFAISGAATLLATAIGTACGLLAQALPRRRAWALTALALPLAVPTYVHALTWADLMKIDVIRSMSIGANSSVVRVAGVIWVQAVSHFSISAVVTFAWLQRWKRTYSDAAHANGQAPRRVVLLKLRYLRDGAIVGALVTWLLIFSDFAVPDLFQVSTYATEIFIRASSYLDVNGALSIALPAILLPMLCFLGIGALARREASGTQQSHSPRGGEGTGGNPLILSFTSMLAFVVLLALPIGNLVVMSNQGELLANAVSMGWKDLTTSLVLAALASAAVTAIAVLAGYSVARAHFPAGAWLPALAFATFSVPTSLLGVASIAYWNVAGIRGWLYDLGAGLVAALLAHWLLLGVVVVLHGWRQIDQRQEEAAFALGVGWVKTLMRISIPQLWPSVAAAFLLTFIFVLNELMLVTLLAPPGLSTLPLRIFQTVHYGPPSLLAALCLMQLCVLSVPLVLLAVVMRHVVGPRTPA